MSWEKRCHDHDFGRLLEDGRLLWVGDGGSLLLNERDVAVACFSEIAVFRDAMFGSTLVVLMAYLHVLQSSW